MTPPSAKPEASATDDAATENFASETLGAKTPLGEAGGEVTRIAKGGRRRAASLELRVARGRPVSAAEGDAPETAETQTPAKTGRKSASGVTRLRPKAQARATRAAQAEAKASVALVPDAPPADPGAAAETAETQKPAKTGRKAVTGVTRLRPKAQARATRAAQAEAEAQVPDATDPPGAEPDPMTEDTPPVAPEFSTVRRRTPQSDGANIPTPPAAEPEADPAPAAEVAVLATTLPPAVAPTAHPVPVRPDDPPPQEDDEGDEDDDQAPGGRRRMIRAERRAGRTGKANDASNYVVAPTVSPAQMRPRHYGVIALFLLCVIVPTISYSWYLWTRAADQYESDVGFGSRTEEAAATFDFLGALGGTTQSGSKDMDILNQFIISQELVAKIDAELDLKAIFSRPGNDPLNAFNPDGTIEDLVAYWQRMVLVNYDTGTGLMNLRIFAFDPVDAQKIAFAVLTESTAIINQLSKTAQEDTTRYSKDSLAATEAKLAATRLAVLDYQVRNNIVDPSNVVANQLSVVSTLNQQLASAQIELDMLAGTVPAGDPRIATLNRKLDVIRNRISEEQSKVGAAASGNSPGFAKLMADFEKLKVEQEFAQAAYLSALAAHDQALTEAQQKTRYLATYVAPTLAEAPTAPNRPLIAALTALIGFLIWSTSVLTYYALRDRR